MGLDPLVVMRVVNGPTVQDVARVPVEGRLAADTEHLAAPRDPKDRNGALGTRPRALANGLGALDVVGLADVNGGLFRSCISLSGPLMARLAYSCAAHATLWRALFHALDKATAVGCRAGTHDGGLEDSCSRRLMSRLLVGHPVLGKLRDHTLHVQGPIDVLDEDLVAVDRAAQGAHLGHELVDAALQLTVGVAQGPRVQMGPDDRHGARQQCTLHVEQRILPMGLELAIDEGRRHGRHQEVTGPRPPTMHALRLGLG